MSILGAREIYRFARLAGFSPDQASTMTAIALAESEGDTGAHNPHGEDSRGLWQINVRAHPDLGRRDLYDPLENARAAFDVSRQGHDVSPWTTTHGGSSAPYLTFRAQAQAAARASGDPAELGVWTGSDGYGHALAAGSSGPATGHPGPLRTFLDSALAQQDDPYVWGAEARASDADPDAFDCSELVQWSAARAHVDLPDGSWLQYRALAEQNATIDVDQALKTPGALLFSFSSDPTAGGGRPAEAHVAISLGNGRTIEARGRSSGIGSWSAGHRFNYGAVIPGISDGGGGALTGTGSSSMLLAGVAGKDSDKDGVTDILEARLGLSPTEVDSDHDNLSDGYELLTTTTDASSGDSDHDHLVDSLELALGTNPLDPDSDRDGVMDGSSGPAATLDTDSDRLTDELERALGTDPTGIDSDADGFTDAAERAAGFDPADPLSSPLAPGASEPGSSLTQAPPVEPDSWGLDDPSVH